MLSIKDREERERQRAEFNPFKLQRNYIKVPILLMENIPYGIKFSKLIRCELAADESIYSIVFQTLTAIAMGQDACRLVHYDLHANNILLRKLTPEVVHVYRLQNGECLAIPTFGHSPVLIDYGFSYTQQADEDQQKNGINSSFEFMDIGYTSHMFDKWKDIKVMLVSLQNEIDEFRHYHKFTRLFTSLVRQLFFGCNLDWECGWDDDRQNIIPKIPNKFLSPEQLKKAQFDDELYISANTFFRDYLLSTDYFQKFKNFNNEDLFITGLLKLIRLPLNMNIQFVNKYKNEYMMLEGPKREALIRNFKNDIFEKIRKIIQYPKLQCDYERLFVSLCSIADCYEALLYYESSAKTKFKARNYERIKLCPNPIAVLKTLLQYFPLQYEYKADKTKIYFFDAQKQLTKSRLLLSSNEEHIKLINQLNNPGLGSQLQGRIIAERLFNENIQILNPSTESHVNWQNNFIENVSDYDESTDDNTSGNREQLGRGRDNRGRDHRNNRDSDNNDSDSNSDIDIEYYYERNYDFQAVNEDSFSDVETIEDYCRDTARESSKQDEDRFNNENLFDRRYYRHLYKI
eukprot:Pgem_evm4s12025